MSWAERNELPPAKKVSHQHVEYEDPAQGKDHCGICKNFIPGHPNRCRTVKTPIAEAAWCVRFSPKGEGGKP